MVALGRGDVSYERGNPVSVISRQEAITAAEAPARGLIESAQGLGFRVEDSGFGVWVSWLGGS